jgi:hypothetical protein
MYLVSFRDPDQRQKATPEENGSIVNFPTMAPESPDARRAGDASQQDLLAVWPWQYRSAET